MQVYFARHGKTDGNTQRFIPSSEEPLNDVGKGEVEFLVKRFESIPIEVVFSSKYARAKETAICIAKEKNLQCILLPELNELFRGDEFNGKKYADSETKAFLDTWWQELDTGESPTAQKKSAESYEELKARVENVLNTLQERPEETIGVVTHSATLRMFFGLIVFKEQLTPSLFRDLFFNLDMRTTGISVAEYTKEKGWRMLVWNDCAHLGDPQ